MYFIIFQRCRTSLIYKESNIRLGRKNKRKSIGIIYDKSQKDLHDRHNKRIDILNNEYPIRLEFCLHKKNCNYLSIDNFKGTIYWVMTRYYRFLVIQYSKYFLKHIEIDLERNISMKYLVLKAEKNKAQRYTGTVLKKTETIKGIYRKPNQIKNKAELREIIYRKLVENNVISNDDNA